MSDVPSVSPRRSQSRRCPACKRRIPRLTLRCPNCNWTAPYRLLVLALIPVCIGGALVSLYLAAQPFLHSSVGNLNIQTSGAKKK
jgi:hypothetical protein